MKQRTEEEKRRILKKCLEIERDGGDVLAYLSSEHYVSPGATWTNMQRYELNRPIGCWTDGKPTGKKIRGSVKEIRKVCAEEKRKIRTENAIKAARIAIEGGDVMAFLLGKGYEMPQETWYKMKNDVLKKQYPELYAQLPGSRMSGQYAIGTETEKDKPETEARTKVKKRRTAEQMEAAYRKALEACAEGNPPIPVLRNEGYRCPLSAWREAKIYCRKHWPELYSRIPEETPREGGWKTLPRRVPGEHASASARMSCGR